MTVPYAVRAAMFSPNADDGVVAIFTISRGATVIGRYVSFDGDILDADTLRSGVVSGGLEYTPAIVSYNRPDDTPGKAPELTLTIENVVQDLGALAKRSVNDLAITLRHIAISDPDTVVETFPDLYAKLVTADLDTNTVSMDLTLDPLKNEPVTMLRFTPDQFPGLFP